MRLPYLPAAALVALAIQLPTAAQAQRVVANHDAKVWCGSYSAYANGAPQSCYLATDRSVTLALADRGGQRGVVSCAARTMVRFHPNGGVASCTAAELHNLRSANHNGMATCRADTIMRFDLDARVDGCED